MYGESFGYNRGLFSGSDRCYGCDVGWTRDDGNGNRISCMDPGNCHRSNPYAVSISKAYEVSRDECCYSGNYPGCSVSHSGKLQTHKKAKEEDNKMSFVGLQFNKTEKKIIAFADTKSTRFYSDRPVADANPVHKIFANNALVMVSWGTNEYIDEKGNICPINSLISPNLDNLQDAFQALRDSFSQLENAKSEFILGKRGMDEVFYVSVTGKAIIEKREKFPEDVLTVYGGRDEYIRIFDQNSRLNQMDGLGIKREIEGMVEFFDKHLDYNYVGGEIEILEWDWQY